MILDAHHHLWRYSQDEYGWISPAMSCLARDFTVADLRVEASSSGVVGSIAVQARQSVEETDALLAVAEQDGLLRGVVGWAPLADPRLGEVLDRWEGRGALVGLRHVVQDEPDEGFLDRSDFNRGVAECVRRGLAYDVLIYARQLKATIRLVDRHPEGRFVVDHLGKPSIRVGETEEWARQLRELAERPNVSCKVSGVVTEADWRAWTPDQVRPYLDAALEAFGPHRLLFGSDWPVCLLATSYAGWFDLVSEWSAGWSLDERESLFFGAACRAYRLRQSTDGSPPSSAEMPVA